ncbi:FAD binding domain protein [Aspergillus tubingensis]|uniref:FAD binding domain protein n=1 Tax=Aspergillus tubingensis TaxID=5068 RepID=UPI0015788DEA|nr:FAD binding domain protein [Aspergillus tubingensis]GFN19172.1 FAD binding domain protein [Aspergillus tubingensis]
MHLSTFVGIIALAERALTSSLQCKCAPNDACWPPVTEWDSLNTTVSGRLIETIPVGSVCYPSEPTYDAEACAAVRTNWTTWPFHSDNSVSTGNPDWDDACTPIYANGTSVTANVDAGKEGCSIGNYPPYVVNATQVHHVQAAVKFAKKWNLRLNIKNTGHSGWRSIAYGSLSIWTHHMKSFEFHDKFKPESCQKEESTMAATLGAGIQDGELFANMAKHDAIAVGGENADVGVVGWATGGGHGLATGTYGMGADNIVEATVVTPDGRVLKANACQNQDLFWALRGGGGGTFGVITSLTVKAYKMPSVTLAMINVGAKNSTSTKSWYQLVAQMHTQFPRLQDAGLHGYYTMSGSPKSITVTLLQYNKPNTTSILRLSEPLLEVLNAANSSATHSFTTEWVPSWYTLVEHVPMSGSTGSSHSATASRLIPRRALENVDLLADVLETVTSPDNVPIGVSKPSISGTMTASKEPVDNALNPAWRETAVHLIASRSWDDSVSEDVANQVTEDMTFKRGYALRQLAPDAGAYFNEANYHEPNWQWSLFGNNYPRLHSIKKVYDPESVLWCHHCVGSEEWALQDNGSLCQTF